MPINIDIVDKAISIVAKRTTIVPIAIKGNISLSKAPPIIFEPPLNVAPIIGGGLLLENAYKNNPDAFKKIFVICPTDSINSFYITITDKSCIFNEFNENWANQLIDQLMQVNSDNNQDKKRVLLILSELTCINWSIN